MIELGEWHFMEIAFLSILLALTGCSSVNSRLQKYRELDTDAKALYLDIFPTLDSGQKMNFLDGPGNLQDLKYKKIVSGESKGPLRKPLALRIEPVLTESINQGHFLEFKAYVDYPTEKNLNVTSDVIWSYVPLNVKMEENRLQVDCFHSDVSVSASFFDEVETTQTIHFTKPLKNIAVHLAEASSIMDSKDVIKLNSNAICQDNSTSEISCRTQWQVNPDSGTFLGCGQFIPTAKSWHEGSVTITLSYGGLTVTRRVYLPNRIPYNK
jgi:hypothetical protein